MDWLSAGIQAEIPILGICLGHQAIGKYFGAKLERAPRAIHGEAHVITHSAQGLFAHVPQNTHVTRYHSLVIKDLPAELLCEARSEDCQIMAIRHAHKPIYGIQFHPESFLSEHGLLMLQNFLACSRAASSTRSFSG
jgi:anthranilate synthase component 2